MTITASSPSGVPGRSAQPEHGPRQAYVPSKVPAIHIGTSLLGLGPIPFRWLIDVLALVREQHRIGVYRPAEVPSHLESEIRATGLRGAMRVREKGERSIHHLAYQVGRLQARISYLEAAMSNYNNTLLAGPHRQSLTLSDAAELEKKLRCRVEDETEKGSLEHRRVSEGARRMTWIAPPIDLPVLGYFLGKLFNVNWMNPADQPATFATAVVFAILGTVGLALGLRALGRTMRAHKNNKGQLELPEGGDRALPLMELLATAAAMVGAGVIMFCRIYAEAGPTVPKLVAILLGAFFAIVVIIVNWVVYAAEFRDGSILTEQIDTLASNLIKRGVKRQRMSDEVHRLQEKVTVLQHERQWVAADTLVAVDAPLKAADQLILKARSYHLGTYPPAGSFDSSGTNGQHGFTEPSFTVDVRALEAAAKPRDDQSSEGLTL